MLMAWQGIFIDLLQNTYLEKFNLPRKNVYILFLTKAMLHQICPLFKQTSNMTLLGVRGNLPPGIQSVNRDEV